MGKLWILGEALIDFVPTEAEGEHMFAPRCGGSPYNAAIAAARQGADTSFLGALSNDFFGEMLTAKLKEDGVDVTDAEKSAHPTTLAFVDFQGDEPRYAFFNRQSSTQLMAPDPALISPASADILHVGSISLIDNPGANNIRDFVTTMSSDMLVSVDPNARPSMTEDPDDWRQRIFSILNVANIAKLSDEDLEYLSPAASPDDFAARLLADGLGLVVITQGKDGVLGYTKNGKVHVPARLGELVDTVGAGDTVMGTLLASLQETDAATSLDELDTGALAEILTRCMVAACLNCAQSGCNPPTRAETFAKI